MLLFTKKIIFPPQEGDKGGGKLSTARSKLEGYYLQKEYYFPPLRRGGGGRGTKGEEFLVDLFFFKIIIKRFCGKKTSFLFPNTLLKKIVTAEVNIRIFRYFNFYFPGKSSLKPLFNFNNTSKIGNILVILPC